MPIGRTVESGQAWLGCVHTSLPLKLRHTRTPFRHTCAKEIRHTRACRGYLAEPCTRPRTTASAIPQISRHAHTPASLTRSPAMCEHALGLAAVYPPQLLKFA